MSDEEKSEGRNFFMGYDDLSDSSSDSDENASNKNNRGGPESSGGSDPQSRKRAAEALPKPDDLFQSVRKPAFLYNPLNKVIDWDRRTVKAPEEPPKEFKVWKTNAVPPPQTYVTEEKKKGPPAGMDMAIKWSNVYEDNGEDAPQSHRGTARFLPEEEGSTHLDSDDDDDDDGKQQRSSKKRRVETFQQKEKRKRDIGQATSDKNFVEEEKRILRQCLD